MTNSRLMRNVLPVGFVLLILAALPSFSAEAVTSAEQERQQRVLDSLRQFFVIRQCCSSSLGRCLDREIPCEIATRLDAFARWVVTKTDSYSRALQEMERRYLTFCSPDTFPIETGGFPWIGDDQAPARLVVYVSASCGTCKRVVHSLTTEIATGSLRGKARLLVKPFGAGAGDRALIAAARANVFIPFLDSLSSIPGRHDEEMMIRIARNLGLNQNEFRKSLRAPATERDLHASRNEGRKNGVEITPTIFINSRRYRSYKDIQWIVDAVEFEHSSDSPPR